MGHNSRRSADAGPLVARLVTAVATRLADEHTSIDAAVVYDVVQQAAVELASAVADPDQLRRMLPLRAGARLMALAGTPIPIRSTRRALRP